MARHDAILTEEIERAGGRVVNHLGDGLFAAFPAQPGDPAPLQAALEMQRRLAAETWPFPGGPRVRLGLHLGPAEARGDDLFGLDVNRAARLMSAAWGGQILLSPEVAASCGLPAGAQTLDLGRHVLKDLAEPQQILELLLPGQAPYADAPPSASAFPTLRSLSARPNNLPRQSTPFIGRRRELKELGDLFLQHDCRLVTLLGPGGMGKTRLSLQVAAEIGANAAPGRYSHGIYFIALAPLTQAGHIPVAVADAMGYQFPQTANLAGQLAAYFQDKELLLVLDNFEHLLDGVEYVAEWLQAAPNLRILATSRERLNLQAECVYELGGLQSPTSSEDQVFEDFEAIELFTAYARRARPNYSVTPAHRPALATICRLVGGMPLALQLAAAWVRTLSPEQIAVELKADLDFLAANQRDLPERHRSMRAAFDYSWNLMTPATQDAFAALSIFRGGFSRAAAQAVAGLRLPVLAELQDKSLLQADSNQRYQVHELLRQFAWARLQQDPARAAALSQAHTRYYAGWLEGIRRQLMGASNADEARILEIELDNVRAAWNWTLEHSAVEFIGGLTLTILIYGQMRAKYHETHAMLSAGVQMIEQVNLPDDAASQQLRGDVHLMRGWMSIRLGRLDEAEADARVAESIYQKHTRPGSQFVGSDERSLLAIIYSIRGEYERALVYGETAYQASIIANDTFNAAECAYVLIGVYSGLGQYEKAMHYGRQALSMFQEYDFKWFDGYIYLEMGRIEQAQGRLDGASEYYQRCLQSRQNFGDPEGVAVARLQLGNIALEQNDLETAQLHFDQALTVYHDLGDRGGLAGNLHGLGVLALRRGQSDAARRLLAEGLQLAASIDYIPLVLQILFDSRPLLESDDPALALALLHTLQRHPAAAASLRQRAAQALGPAAGDSLPMPDLLTLVQTALAALGRA